MLELGLRRVGLGTTFGRLAWGIVIGFALLHALTSIYYGHERMVSQAGLFAESVAERAVVLAKHESSDPDFIEVLGSHFGLVRFTNQPGPPPERVWPHTEEIRDAVVQRLRENNFPDAQRARVFYSSYRGEGRLQLQLPLADGRWLEVQAARSGLIQGHTVMGLVWTTVMGLLVMVAVLWATRRVTRQLPQFAAAAERVGRNVALPPLPERGPREIRRMSEAFNAMQSRVTGLLDERNTLLGSLSHDVRTLVTRLGLRMEAINDVAQKAKAEQDIRTITTLLDEALRFSRDDGSDELAREVDLPSMLQALLDDENDTSKSAEDIATFDGPQELTLVAQPGGIRRALANLISNAVRYGGSVNVVLRESEGESGSEVSVAFTDPGSGIAPADRERAFKPYVRLESSRNRNTGGTGLGLAIVANVVQRHGGSIEFPESDKGFTVQIRLPRQPG